MGVSKRGLLGFLAFMLIVSVAITGLTYLKTSAQGDRINKIERTIQYQYRFPCENGKDINCRKFLAVLLDAATKKQLHDLLVIKELAPTKKNLQHFFNGLGHVTPNPPSPPRPKHAKPSILTAPLGPVRINNRISQGKGVMPGNNGNPNNNGHNNKSSG
jgi:hypothetical protein